MGAPRKGRGEPRDQQPTGGASGESPSTATRAENRATAPQGADEPPSGGATVLVLLRHGESAVTAQKRFSGSGGSGADADPPLSAHGRAQARQAAQELAERYGTAVTAVVTSPLTRCRRTAQAAADRLGLCGPAAPDAVAVEPALRETDFGAWEGLTFAEARERHPDAMDAWLADPAAAAPPGGESFGEVAARVAAARDALLARYAGRTVLVVTHVTPIKSLVRLALGAPHAALFRFDVAPASLSEIAYYPDGNASVRGLNATAHLRPPLPAPPRPPTG